MTGSHRAAPTTRRVGRPGREGPPGPGLVRTTALALTAVVGVVLLVPSAGTLAAWNDRATVVADGFDSGRLDLSVDGGTGSDTTHARPDLALTGMVPGETSAATVAVGNSGDADLRWTAAVSTGGGLGPALQVELWLGGRATGDDTTYPRTESCGGGTRLAPGTPVRVDRGGARDLCVLARLPDSTGDEFQDRSSGSVTLRLEAAQVTSP